MKRSATSSSGPTDVEMDASDVIKEIVTNSLRCPETESEYRLFGELVKLKIEPPPESLVRSAAEKMVTELMKIDRVLVFPTDSPIGTLAHKGEQFEIPVLTSKLRTRWPAEAPEAYPKTGELIAEELVWNIREDLKRCDEGTLVVSVFVLRKVVAHYQTTGQKNVLLQLRWGRKLVL
jgi:hypothetical protein